MYIDRSSGKDASEPAEEDIEDISSGPEAQYSAENARFASRYETEDGKIIRYTSEKEENYGGLFDFDFSGDKRASGEVDNIAGAVTYNGKEIATSIYMLVD